MIAKLLSWFNSVQSPVSLEQAGHDAIARASQQWARGIWDPSRRETGPDAQWARGEIDTYIRHGLGWTWEPPYAGDGDFEWCGAFAAWCWASVRPQLRKTYFASTYRLDRFARYASVNGEKNRGSGRLCAELDESSRDLPFTPQPGDILLIGPKGSGYGKHICLVESYTDGVFFTLEGNGNGMAPTGVKWQGVVKGKRYLGGADRWHARRLIRPSVEDLG